MIAEELQRDRLPEQLSAKTFATGAMHTNLLGLSLFGGAF